MTLKPIKFLSMIPRGFTVFDILGGQTLFAPVVGDGGVMMYYTISLTASSGGGLSSWLLRLTLWIIQESTISSSTAMPGVQACRDEYR